MSSPAATKRVAGIFVFLNRADDPLLLQALVGRLVRQLDDCWGELELSQDRTSAQAIVLKFQADGYQALTNWEIVMAAELIEQAGVEAAWNAAPENQPPARTLR